MINNKLDNSDQDQMHPHLNNSSSTMVNSSSFGNFLSLLFDKEEETSSHDFFSSLVKGTPYQEDVMESLKTIFDGHTYDPMYAEYIGINEPK